jgi:ABC-type cobalamin/Fe3+-siderophores transport system ATPase subunit
MQDSARAWPHEAPVDEVLGPGAPLPALRRWFGAAFTADLLSRPIGALSEGERQRVLLAAEVLRLEQRPGTRRSPRVLLLDEPFGALDPPQHIRLMEEILQWLRASQGRNAAVLVTHSPLMDLGLARAGGVPAIEWTIGEVV